MTGPAATTVRLRRSLLGYAFASPLYGLTLGRRAPRDLALVPPDPWPGSAERGAALLGGTFRFAGVLLRSDLPPWEVEGVGEDVLAAMHGFDWLHDLRALGGDAARRQARLLVAAWLDRHDRWDPLVWRPDVLGLRVANWLGAHDFFIASAEDGFRARVFASLARQVRHLVRAAPGELAGPPLLVALKGLIYGALALPGAAPRLGWALRLLERELPRQVLPDGGHIQRNPATHLAALRHLIDLRAILRAGRAVQPQLELPDALQHAIDRMTPALRFFRHGDGGLAVFNGGHEGEAVLIDTVLAQADARGRPLKSARHSGFERVLAGRTLLLMDVGRPPPAGLDGDAHAGLLSFELSVGRERMIVNCGGFPGRSGPEAAAWNLALRGTAAHSTVTVEASNAVALRERGGIARRPEMVTSMRQAVEGAVLIDASHDGYRPQFGLVHRRRVFLGAGGDDLRGEDTLVGSVGPPPEGHAFAVRFHLHPTVRASLVQGGEAVVLRLPGGMSWRLRAAGGTLGLEESVYFALGEERRQTSQIVIAGRTGSEGTPGAATVRWALKQERKP